MGLLGSYVTTKFRQLAEAAVSTVAAWDPDSVGEAQLAQWAETAKEMSNTAAKARVEAKEAAGRVTTLKSEIERLTAAGEKLLATNETAANTAIDRALALQEELTSAEADAADSEAWADEALASAKQASEIVLRGRQRIDAAKREQARAERDQDKAEKRLEDRQRMAGLKTGISGGDAAIAAMEGNARKARLATEAANIQAGVLGKGADDEAAIQAALREVDGKSTTGLSAAEKLAKLKKV